MEGLSDSLIGVNAVSVCCECRDLDSVFVYGSLKFIKLLLIGKKLGRVTVSLSGISAGSYLNCLNSEGLKSAKSLVKRLVSVKVSKYTKFHF